MQQPNTEHPLAELLRRLQEGFTPNSPHLNAPINDPMGRPMEDPMRTMGEMMAPGGVTKRITNKALQKALVEKRGTKELSDMMRMKRQQDMLAEHARAGSKKSITAKAKIQKQILMTKRELAANPPAVIRNAILTKLHKLEAKLDKIERGKQTPLKGFLD